MRVCWLYRGASIKYYSFSVAHSLSSVFLPRSPPPQPPHLFCFCLFLIYYSHALSVWSALNLSVSLSFCQPPYSYSTPYAYPPNPLIPRFKEFSLSFLSFFVLRLSVFFLFQCVLCRFLSFLSLFFFFSHFSLFCSSCVVVGVTNQFIIT